ncbi:folate transporter 1-like [Topomyia yanbarensis]|uniref:folate transporter 1-like n=1 Tax=Topomyia yanbarensis TaxID=2498891 RepID=UPI00273AE0C4|nr:folate transporter 1-like [Topomyia yanbarensis]
MEKWQQFSLILSSFGFLKEFRPSEPFVYPFLIGPCYNITIAQAQDVLSIGTYSYMAQLVVVFLITDYFRYKPLIIVAGLAGTLVWIMFVWSSSLRALQLLEVFYGTYMAADIAYWTYIYAKVDRKHYQKVTSHIRSATQAGRFLTLTLSKILIYYEVTDYLGLNYISLGAQLATTIWAFLLPHVHRKEQDTEEKLDLDPIQKITPSSTCSRTSSHLWFHFKSAYTSFTVIRYSIWYSLAVCLYYQITTYVPALWNRIGGRDATLWNGAVEAILTLIGSLVALLAGFVSPSWLQMNTTLLGLAAIAVLEGLGLLVATVTSNIMVSYVGFSVLVIMHAFAITLVSSEIAKHVPDASFALVFGISTLVGLVSRTLLNLAVADIDGWFALDIREQFTVYGFGLLGVGVLFAIFLLVELGRRKCYRLQSLLQLNKDGVA